MSNTQYNAADSTNWKSQLIVDISCLYKEWWVSLAVSVLSKGKDYFTNVLTSCQHSWQCDIWMSHCQECWQFITAFHKSGKLYYIRFVALRVPLIWGVKVLHTVLFDLNLLNAMLKILYIIFIVKDKTFIVGFSS